MWARRGGAKAAGKARVTPFERYIQSGGRRPGLWRVLAGAAITAALWIGGTFGVLFLWSALNVARKRGTENLLATLNGAGEGGPELVAVLLLTFAGIWIGVILAVRLLHRQEFATLFSPERRIRGGDFLKGLLVAAAFTGLSLPFALSVAQPDPAPIPISIWLALLVPIIALVFVQATAEELMFRGYLLQQLALRSRNPLVWAVLPSALFGALHWSGAMPGEAGLMYVGTTFLMGIALAVLVSRTGSLWAAAGMHVGFNVIGLTVVGTEGLLSGAQLFLFPHADLPQLMRIDFAMTGLLLAFVLSPWAPFGPPRDEEGGATA